MITSTKTTIIFELIALLFVGFILYKVDFSNDRKVNFYLKEDIYFEYQFAKQFQNNKNPYDKILDSNMLENNKYATQLPLYFYFLSAVDPRAGNNFEDFIKSYRVVLFWVHLAGGCFIYLIFRRTNKLFLGFCAASFYMFNVWSLNSIIYLKQDMIAIALLIFSFYLFSNSKYRWLSYILFGLSLGIKHIGIFALPLYLTPLLYKEDSFKKFSFNILLLIYTLLIPSIPFLATNPTSFVKSMLFSLTREPTDDSQIIYGYSELLVKYNSSFDTGTWFTQLLPRLPLVCISVLSALLLFLRKVPLSVYLFMSILGFAVFNPVIFPQYITWIIPVAMISLVEIRREQAVVT